MSENITLIIEEGERSVGDTIDQNLNEIKEIRKKYTKIREALENEILKAIGNNSSLNTITYNSSNMKFDDFVKLEKIAIEDKNLNNNSLLSLEMFNSIKTFKESGIDYLNEEFIRPDDTSRIVRIWDQTIQDNTDNSVYIGQVYSNDQINNAIKAYRNKEDPYKIVPLRDEVGHGSEMFGKVVCFELYSAKV